MRAAILCALLAAAPALAQGDPDADRLVVIHAQSVITVSGETFTPGSIVIRNGEIEAVGARVDVPPQARVIDARDQVAMPALINPRTRFSLGSYSRSGNNASRSTLDELLVRPGQFEPLLRLGVGIVAIHPSGGGLPGQAGVVELPAAGALDAPGYLRVTMYSLPRDKSTLEASLRQAQQAIEKEAKAREAYDKKHASGSDKKPAGPRRGPRRGGKAAEPELAAAPVADLAEPAPVDSATKPKPKPPFEPPKIAADLQPLVKLLRKAKDAPRLLLELNSASGLLHAEQLLERFEVEPFGYLVSAAGDSDMFHVVEQLGEAKARVLVYPRMSTEPYTLTQRNLPAELARAGARVSFVTVRDEPNDLLPGLALLVRDGLPRDVALAGVTLRAAELLGVEAEAGSLEAGKRGHVALFDRDPLAPGARVTRLVMAGETVWTEE